MSTSNTFNFNPTITDLVLEAFERISIQPNQLTPRHMFSSRMSANLALQSWSLRGVNLWAVDLQTVPLSKDQATYLLDTATEAILDAYVTRTGSDGTNVDFSIAPLSRTDYAAIARKDDAGPPTQYWFERIIAPQVTLWLVPDADTTYTLKYYRLRRLQDADFVGGQTPDVHYRFLDAFAAEMAARLAEKFAPAMLSDKIALAQAAWKLASAEDREMADLQISPDFNGYFS